MTINNAYRRVWNALAFAHLEDVVYDLGVDEHLEWRGIDRVAVRVVQLGRADVR